MVSTRPLLRMRSPISGRPTRNLLVIFGCIAYAIACVGVLFLRPISSEDLDQPLHAMLHPPAGSSALSGRADVVETRNYATEKPVDSSGTVATPVPPTIDRARPRCLVLHERT